MTTLSSVISHEGRRADRGGTVARFIPGVNNEVDA